MDIYEIKIINLETWENDQRDLEDATQQIQTHDHRQ